MAVIEVRITLDREDFAKLVRRQEVVSENGRIDQHYRIRIVMPPTVSFGAMAHEVLNAMLDAASGRSANVAGCLLIGAVPFLAVTGT